jgi:hypothetical protein
MVPYNDEAPFVYSHEVPLLPTSHAHRAISLRCEHVPRPLHIDDNDDETLVRPDHTRQI